MPADSDQWKAHANSAWPIEVGLMIYSPPDDSPPDDTEFPVAEVVARHLLDCARDDPMLVRRSRSRGHDARLAVQGLSGRRREPLPPITLESHSEQATSHYLEDLVSLAIESAQQADCALQQALTAKVRAKRGIAICAGIAAIGTLIGVAGVASSYFHRSMDRKVTEIASEVRSLNDQQVATSKRLTTMRAEYATRQKVAAVQSHLDEVTTPTAAPPQPVSSVAMQTAPPYRAPPVSSLRMATYSSPWPTYRRPMWPTVHRQTAQPEFFAVILRRVRTLLR